MADAKKVCSGCRTINEPASAYCYRCGLKLPDQLLSRAEVAGDPAGFWIRLGAYVIDQVGLSFASGLLVVLVATAKGYDLEQSPPDIQEAFKTGLWLTLLGVEIVYYTVATAQWGRTAGKAILGLKVTRVDGSRLTYQRSFARYWTYLVSAIPLGFGFIAIALSSQKRGWHDLICDTRVVNLRS